MQLSRRLLSLTVLASILTLGSTLRCYENDRKQTEKYGVESCKDGFSKCVNVRIKGLPNVKMCCNPDSNAKTIRGVNFECSKDGKFKTSDVDIIYDVCSKDKCNSAPATRSTTLVLIALIALCLRVS